MFDTVEEQSAAVGYGLGFLSVLPVAHASIAIEDAAVALGLFYFPAPVSTPAFLPDNIIEATVTFAQVRHTVTFNENDMTLLASITEGWTGRLQSFTLLADGEPLDLTGLTVELILRGRDGVLVTDVGTLTLLDQLTNPGELAWDPPGDLDASKNRYTMRFRVTDSDDKVEDFPEGEPYQLAVYRP